LSKNLIENEIQFHFQHFEVPSLPSVHVQGQGCCSKLDCGEQQTQSLPSALYNFIVQIMEGSEFTRYFFCWLIFVITIPLAAQNQQAKSGIPAMDAGVGPCSVEFTVTDTAGQPVYAAKVQVHIAYGFAGIHKLDLEAGTNADGKIKFVGLPEKVHKPPLEFHVSKDSSQGLATYTPSAECHAEHKIVLQKP
jgi:hypothetical protein